MTDTGCINVIPLVSDPALTVTKTGSVQGDGTVGDTIIYQVIIANTGSDTLTEIMVSDPQVTLSPMGPVTLGPGGSFLAEGVYTITEADAAAGEIVNIATATALDGAGETITTNSLPVTSPIEPPPEDTP